jgi:hypothetical protein
MVIEFTEELENSLVFRSSYLSDERKHEKIQSSVSQPQANSRRPVNIEFWLAGKLGLNSNGRRLIVGGQTGSDQKPTVL